MKNSDFIDLERQTAEYVTKLYDSPTVPHYPFHNLTHTRGVAAHAQEMATHYKLAEQDRFIVVVSAWFHDVGHLNGPMAGHEERGVLLLRDHLSGLPPELLTAMSGCILATKFPSHPTELLHQILCDADTYHLGTGLFLQTDPLVQKEVELRTGKVISNWRQRSLDFLRLHQFFTEYCQRLLNARKAENIAWVEAHLAG